MSLWNLKVKPTLQRRLRLLTFWVPVWKNGGESSTSGAKRWLRVVLDLLAYSRNFPKDPYRIFEKTHQPKPTLTIEESFNRNGAFKKLQQKPSPQWSKNSWIHSMPPWVNSSRQVFRAKCWNDALFRLIQIIQKQCDPCVLFMDGNMDLNKKGIFNSEII